MDAGSIVPRWLPNAISVVRILLIPVWGLVAEEARAAFLLDDHATAGRLQWWAVAILVTIGVSDVVDGWIARRFGLTSRAGATLDAVADKLAQVALILFFTVRGAPAFPQSPVWFLLLLFARDLAMLTGWLILRRERGQVRVVHRAHGKIASLLLFVLLVLLSAGVDGVWVSGLTWTIAALVVFSTLAYVRDGFDQRPKPDHRG